MAKLKYPEWIVFEGKRFEAKLTKKRIVVFSGKRSKRFRGLDYVEQDDTIAYNTSVPDWGDGSWYGNKLDSIGYDSYDFKLPCQIELDPPNFDDASPAILERIQKVRDAAALREKEEAEEKVRMDKAAALRRKLSAFSAETRQMEIALLDAVKEGDPDLIMERADLLHKRYKEKPPVSG